MASSDRAFLVLALADAAALDGLLLAENVRRQMDARALGGDYTFSSTRFLKCSSASGFASASRFFTGRPCTISRTASSTILPLLVRGMSRTCSTLAGTWRGGGVSRIR